MIFKNQRLLKEHIRIKDKLFPNRSEPFNVPSMHNDPEFKSRRIVLHTQKRVMGHRYTVELSHSKVKCYVTCRRNGFDQVLSLYARQAAKLI